MRMLKWMALTVLGCQIASVAAPDIDDYPFRPERRQANAARVAADMQTAPTAWKTAPLVYYEVPAISSVKRLPDLFPLKWPNCAGSTSPTSYSVSPSSLEPSRSVISQMVKQPFSILTNPEWLKLVCCVAFEQTRQLTICCGIGR